MDRTQLEKMRDDKRAELKFIDDLLSKLPLNMKNKYPTRRVFSKYTKTYQSPPSGKTWFDWMRSVVQSNGKDMLLSTLGGLAFKSGFVLEDGDKLSNFVGRVYGLKLYMSDEDYPRMFVTVSDVRSNNISEYSVSDCNEGVIVQNESEHSVLDKATNDCIEHILNSVVKNDDVTS